MARHLTLSSATKKCIASIWLQTTSSTTSTRATSCSRRTVTQHSVDQWLRFKKHQRKLPQLNNSLPSSPQRQLLAHPLNLQPQHLPQYQPLHQPSQPRQQPRLLSLLRLQKPHLLLPLSAQLLWQTRKAHHAAQFSEQENLCRDIQSL